MLVERFYNYEKLKDAADCLQIAAEIGLKVIEGRCPATWRNGENPTSVSLSKEGWHDFGSGESGSVIDLVALVMFAGNRQDAQQWIGDRYNLEPAMRLEKDTNIKSRADKLIEQGYSLVKTYDYRDLLNATIHSVCRFEHAEKGKEFVQRTPEKWGVKGIKTLLYRLPEWINSQWVCICEGEKDVESLAALEWPATTNASGAGRWEPYYNDWLKDKSIVIFEDNDKAGKLRTSHLLWELRETVKGIKIIRFPELKEGGDVSDWLGVEGNTKEKLFKIIEDAPAVVLSEITKPGEDYVSVQAAKEANKYNFRNFIPIKDDSGNVIKKPRQINDLITEAHTRFIGFPRKVGETLFDHDRDTNRIEQIGKPAALFAWMSRKSKKATEWIRNEGCITKEEFYEGLYSDARRYEAISYVPDFPHRPDVYYAHQPIPRPDADRKYFDKLISFFCPANDEYKILIKAFFAAPLFYVYGLPKPSWIIDSQDGAGTGKTTLVEQCAALYNTEPIKTHKSEIKQNFGEIMKRVVSSAGRMKRIFLVDNVSGNFVCPEYADMVTARSLSGKAPYGRGEETRPNNLVYVITANSATVDNDISDRSYYIFVKRQQLSGAWKTELNAFIDTYRYNIIADIIAYLEGHEPFEDMPPSTRFPEFETRVLQAFCGDKSEYNDVIKQLFDAKAASNIEEEEAGQIIDSLQSNLINVGCDYASDTVFIRSQVAERWLMEEFPAFRGSNIMQKTRNLAKLGMIPQIDSKIHIWPHHGTGRRRGIMWNFSKEKPVKTIGIRDGKICQIFG